MKNHPSNSSLAAAFIAVQSAPATLPAGDYPAVLESIELLEFDRTRGQSVRARFDVGAGRPLEAWWRLMDAKEAPVRGGIIGIRILLDRLGYREGTYDGSEETLAGIFAEISNSKPELEIRIAYKDDYLNVRVLKGDREK